MWGSQARFVVCQRQAPAFPPSPSAACARPQPRPAPNAPAALLRRASVHAHAQDVLLAGVARRLSDTDFLDHLEDTLDELNDALALEWGY